MSDFSSVHKLVVGIGVAGVIFALFDIFMFGADFNNLFLGLFISASLIGSAFLPQEETEVVVCKVEE